MTGALLAAARKQVTPAPSAPPGDRRAQLRQLSQAIAAIVHRDRNRQVLAGKLRMASQALERGRREAARADHDERDQLDADVEWLTAARDELAKKMPATSAMPRELRLALRAVASYGLGRREYDGEVQAARHLLLQPTNLALVQQEAARE